MNEAPIGIFDSGVGGLTVMKAVMHRLPGESICYFGDNARGPYGSRDIGEIRGFALEIAAFLEDLGVKLIVIACNSATSAGLLEVQRRCRVPVLGVVEPGARGAVQATHNRRIGVIGTRATISIRAYLRAIHALDAGATVERLVRGQRVRLQVEQVGEAGLVVGFVVLVDAGSVDVSHECGPF